MAEGTDAPVTDWELLHRWDWFRRSAWLPTFRSTCAARWGGFLKAFRDIAGETRAEVVLDAGCGLGTRTVCLAEMGLNVVGADVSETAVTHARELARMENAAVTFFPSRWQDLPRQAPHRFDAVLCTALRNVPTYDGLGAAIVGLGRVLKPGGFLCFPALGAESDSEDGVRRIEAEWREEPHEQVDWFHREGTTSVARIRQKKRARDYIDHRFLFAIREGEATRLESTSLREPGYWTWSHWQDLARTAGLSHIETRTFDQCGTGGEPLCLNVAWAAGEAAPVGDDDARSAPYAD
jgi:SAM-dependent methyltransferase